MPVKTNTKQVLVTGGGGFLGGAIIRQLNQNDQLSIHSFSRQHYPELEKLGIHQIQGDLRDRTAVKSACGGKDLVFHVAAKPGVWGPYQDFYNTNFKGTQHVVDACLELGISQLIYTSSPSVIFNGKDMEGVDESVPYPNSFRSHYAQTKALAERYVLKSLNDHLHAIILRPHLIWGPRDNHLVPRIISRANKLVQVGNGHNMVDTTYIDNAAWAHILAADCLSQNPELSGKVYFISQGEPVRLWQMMNDILNAAGLDPVRRKIPLWGAWAVGASMELVFKALRLKSEPLMTRFVVEELATAHWFDISAAKKDLGYHPRISMQQGLDRLRTWLNCSQ